LILLLFLGPLGSIKDIARFHKVLIISKVIIILTLVVLTGDALFHPHSGDAKNPNNHL
jgi:hypothetical protein